MPKGPQLSIMPDGNTRYDHLTLIFTFNLILLAKIYQPINLRLEACTVFTL